MKTLYVSDLDGTLLRSDGTLSDFSRHTLNTLTQSEICFTYATGRSQITAAKATYGFLSSVPRIVYTGTFIIDAATGTPLHSNAFSPAETAVLLDDLLAHGICPVVYSFQHGVERFSYLPDRCTPQSLAFIRSRRPDPREQPVDMPRQLYDGTIFYISCIGDAQTLEPFAYKHQCRARTLFYRDPRSGAQWLEFMPHDASKSRAARALQSLLGCDRLIVFGDGKNDVDLFEAADESYAVENAVDELKAIATGVIASNDEDGVACWLAAHANPQKE